MEKLSEVNSYRDLIVWQKAHKLAKSTLGLAAKFPRTDEARIVKRQLVRAATSVPANIAEGYGGHKGKAYKNYLLIARRSLTETDYWYLLSYESNYIDKSAYENDNNLVNEIRAMLSKIIDKLESNIGSREAVS